MFACSRNNSLFIQGFCSSSFSVWSDCKLVSEQIVQQVGISLIIMPHFLLRCQHIVKKQVMRIYKIINGWIYTKFSEPLWAKSMPINWEIIFVNWIIFVNLVLSYYINQSKPAGFCCSPWYGPLQAGHGIVCFHGFRLNLITVVFSVFACSFTFISLLSHTH